MDAEEIKSALYTHFRIEPDPVLGINDQLLFLGSCFSENIGSKLAHLGFAVKINPFGIIYNPASLANIIEKIATNYRFTQNDLYFYNGYFHSLLHHGIFKNRNAQDLLDNLNRKNREAADFIADANSILISLGTATVYRHGEEKMIVANCHKIPAAEFEKTILHESEILIALEKMQLFLHKIKPELKIIFTISPVKHLRDGVAENALSKARLLSSLAHFIKLKNNAGVHYFPAYEIVTEELRDHRFYAEDLAHPSQWTILYIFKKFIESRFTTEAQNFINAMVKYVRMQSHTVISADKVQQESWEQQKLAYFQKIKSDFPQKEWANINFELK
jgi:hypothetical protein